MFHFLSLLSMYFVVTRLNAFNYSCHGVCHAELKYLFIYLLRQELPETAF